MKHIHNRAHSKRGYTLVELVVAMALTAIFAASCVVLIMPVSKIYKHVNDQSRAQIVADTVIDSLRSECNGAYITDPGDVWIASSGGSLLTSHEENDSGNTLVFRRGTDYCETISADYEITGVHYKGVYDAECERFIDVPGYSPFTDSDGYTSSAVYRLFTGNSGSTAGTPTSDAQSGYVHFGYYSAMVDEERYVCPTGYYDYTSPFTAPTYSGFTVSLNFHDIKRTTDNNMPSYVICDVSVMRAEDPVPVYTRSTVLCFASPVL